MSCSFVNASSRLCSDLTLPESVASIVSDQKLKSSCIGVPSMPTCNDVADEWLSPSIIVEAQMRMAPGSPSTSAIRCLERADHGRFEKVSFRLTFIGAGMDSTCCCHMDMAFAGLGGVVVPSWNAEVRSAAATVNDVRGLAHRLYPVQCI